MNETLVKLLELQQQRTRWIYLAKRQLHTSELSHTLEKYATLDRQLSTQEQQLIESLNLIRQIKDHEQLLFKRWTIKVLVALEVPNFALGKLETSSNILDLYAELWRFWGEFGLATKMDWMKIRIKTHQVSVYRMLAEKLIGQMRKKLMVKIKSYRIFIRTAKPSLEEIPIIMTGSKILTQNPSVQKIEKRTIKLNNRQNMVRSALPIKNRSMISHSNHLIKSSNLQRSKEYQEEKEVQPVLQIKNKKIIIERAPTSQALFYRKKVSIHEKKQVLKSIYEPIDIKIQESYPLKLNREQIFKSLMFRNNMPPHQSSVIKKELRDQERLQTLNDCVGKETNKLKQFRRRINEDMFVRNRISL